MPRNQKKPRKPKNVKNPKKPKCPKKPKNPKKPANPKVPKKKPRKALQTGTTIMGLEYDGGVVIAADSRVTDGSSVANPLANKLTRLSKYHYSCCSGVVTHAQQMCNIVKNRIRAFGDKLGDPLPVHMVAMMFRKTVQMNRSDNATDIITGGWDKHHGGQIYYICPSGMAVRLRIAISGSGGSTIRGFLHGNYRKDMTLEEAVDLVTKAGELALAHDPFSGGVMRIAAVNETGTIKYGVVSLNRPAFGLTSDMLWNLEFKYK
ncbi:hypothetical protein KR093_002132 [Drosophila rubida]|uniref:proteasome endopeptidase complex n=1 Tax=Drosophila rubida TaxID=30044 RepID=A0AAD4PQD4_9MUSC|nr:hypothetical protein KR093_002132 [Drosophila rubida]